MGDHDPLRKRRRARGVLEEGQGVGARSRVAPTGCLLRQDLVRGDPGGGTELRRHGLPSGELAEQGGAGQHRRGAGVAGDRRQAWIGAARPGRIGRDRGHAGVQASPECGDEIQSWRVEQQRPLSRQPGLLEMGTDRPGSLVELRRSEPSLLLLTIRQERVQRAVRGLESTDAQKLYEIQEFRGRQSCLRSVPSANPPSERSPKGQTCRSRFP
jgi:hypothetical protein